MLPLPLPINSIAKDRSTAPGRVIFGPLIDPNCTRRIGTASAPAFAPATSSRSALFPEIIEYDIETPGERLAKRPFQCGLVAVDAIVTSAPSSPWECSASGSRPVAMIFAAPRWRAICTAKESAAPVAPLTRTGSPVLSFARSVSAAQEDMPGLAMDAAVMSSISSGRGMHCAEGTTSARRSCASFTEPFSISWAC